MGDVSADISRGVRQQRPAATGYQAYTRMVIPAGNTGTPVLPASEQSTASARASLGQGREHSYPISTRNALCSRHLEQAGSQYLQKIVLP